MDVGGSVSDGNWLRNCNRAAEGCDLSCYFFEGFEIKGGGLSDEKAKKRDVNRQKKKAMRNGEESPARW